MKIHRLFTLLLPILFLAFSCRSPLDDDLIEDGIKELKLSVVEGKNGFVETNEVDYEFEIIDGNGTYNIDVSKTDGDEDAKVTLNGNRVKVNLLAAAGAELTITDKEAQKATLKIKSTSRLLEVPSFSLILSTDQSYIISNFSFGAGAPYTLITEKGEASTAKFVEEGIKVTNNRLGNTYFKIKDKRGTTANLKVSNILNTDLTSNYLELEGYNTMSITVNFPKNQDWFIVDNSKNAIATTSIARPLDTKTNAPVDYQVLFIETKDIGKGSDTITLRNKNGELAVVKLLVR